MLNDHLFSRCTGLPRLFRTHKRLTFPIRSGRLGSFAVNLTVPASVSRSLCLPCVTSVLRGPEPTSQLPRSLVLRWR